MRTAAALIAIAAGWYYWRQQQGLALFSDTAGHGAAAGDGDASIFNPLPLPDMTANIPAVSTPAPLNAPRGIRNNNPGNIRRTTDKWVGASAQQADPEFVQFKTPAYGMRALARVLQNYQANYGLSTITGIISRWAPPKENDTPAYIRAVAADMGQGANVTMDLFARPDMLVKLMRAIVAHENGAKWRDHYPESLYLQGIQLARG